METRRDDGKGYPVAMTRTASRRVGPPASWAPTRDRSLRAGRLYPSCCAGGRFDSSVEGSGMLSNIRTLTIAVVAAMALESGCSVGTSTPGTPAPAPAPRSEAPRPSATTLDAGQAE